MVFSLKKPRVILGEMEEGKGNWVGSCFRSGNSDSTLKFIDVADGLRIVRVGESWDSPKHNRFRVDVICRVKNVVKFCL